MSTIARKRKSTIESLTSVTKALLLLMKLREIGRPLGLSEIARLIAFKKAGVYRLLVTLEKCGFIERTEGKKYHIGANALYVGTGFPLVHGNDKIQRVMKKLVAETRHTVTMSVLEGNSVLYVARVDGTAPVRVTVEIGSLVCAYASASGKVMLAELDPREVRERFRGVKFRKLTPRTISSLDDLVSTLRQVKSRGFAVNNEEREPGLCAIAVPLKNIAGRQLVSLALSYPAQIFVGRELDELAEKLRLAAKEIEILETLGSFGNSDLDIFKVQNKVSMPESERRAVRRMSL
jgi:DNA-binding IclR family transcriptional regulator